MAKRVQAYGGKATEIKAEVVTDYVAFFGKTLKDKGLETGYFDAFAGSGWTNVGNTEDARGVALRALDVASPLEQNPINLAHSLSP